MVTDNDGTQERAAQTMPGRDELVRVIGDAICEELAGFTVFSGEYRFGDEAEAVLEALGQAGYRIVAADAVVLVPCEPEVLMPGFDPDAYGLDTEGGA